MESRPSVPGDHGRYVAYQCLLKIPSQMIVHDFDSISSLLEHEGYLFKMLANNSGVVLFPHTAEHRDSGRLGIKYEDDSKGNALAAMVKHGRIEFRYHRQFSDECVKQIAQRILALPEFDFAKSFVVTYQSRILIVEN